MTNDKQVFMTVPYFQVPNDVFEIGLNKHEILVYTYLARCSNQGSHAFPSYNTIAKKCSMSRRTAISSIQSLEEKGLLTKQQRFRDYGSTREHNSNIYILKHELSGTDKGGAPNSSHDARNSPRDAQATPGGAVDAHNKELVYKETQQKEIEEAKTVDNAFGVVTSSSLEFYNLYCEKYKEWYKEDMELNPRTKESILDCQIKEIVNNIPRDQWEPAIKWHFIVIPETNDGNILAFLKAAPRYFEGLADTWLENGWWPRRGG